MNYILQWLSHFTETCIIGPKNEHKTNNFFSHSLILKRPLYSPPSLLTTYSYHFICVPFCLHFFNIKAHTTRKHTTHASCALEKKILPHFSEPIFSFVRITCQCERVYQSCSSNNGKCLIFI